MKQKIDFHKIISVRTIIFEKFDYTEGHIYDQLKTLTTCFGHLYIHKHLDTEIENVLKIREKNN